MLESKVADINNVGSGGQAGAITARVIHAPFRRPRNPGCISTFSPGRRAAKPGRPEGGELQAARALYALLADRYG